MAVTITNPAAGQEIKVQTIPGPQGKICVTGNAVDGDSNPATFLAAYAYESPAMPPPAPPADAVHTAANPSGDFEFDEVPNPVSNTSGTAENVLAVWAGFGNPPEIGLSTVLFKGKSAGASTECS